MESVVINQQQTVLINSDTSQVVLTGIMGPRGGGADNIAELTDVDLTQLENGSILVYNASAAVWKATNRLDNQILEAGQF
jgi:hypothetical protein